MKNRWDFGRSIRDEKRKARIWMTVFLYRDWMAVFMIGFVLGYVLSAMR